MLHRKWCPVHYSQCCSEHGKQPNPPFMCREGMCVHVCVHACVPGYKCACVCVFKEVQNTLEGWSLPG